MESARQAVDTTHAGDERQQAILQATRNMLSLSDEYRLVCVAVVAAPPLGGTGAEGDSALHVEHMTRLRSWTAPLGLPMQRLSLHVVVAGDAASALVEFARRNQVDLIVLGAPRPKQQPLAWMRSVASGVTANAQCARGPRSRAASVAAGSWRHYTRRRLIVQRWANTSVRAAFVRATTAGCSRRRWTLTA